MLPPLDRHNWFKEMIWLHVAFIFLTPVAGFWGAYHTKLLWKTGTFSVFYYFFTGLGESHTSCLHPGLHSLTNVSGITAGYHRLWAHRCYNATKPLQYLLALAGAGAIQGSIKWWCRDHRAHHRYTDTELDPYNAHRGLYWSHVGWIMTKPRTRPGMADVSDLKKSDIVQWQHKYFVPCLLFMGFVLPAIIPWLLWGDLQGGVVYAAILRLVFVHHVRTLCFSCFELLSTFRSRPSVSTRLRIGWGRHHSTTNIPQEITLLPLWLRLVKGTITSIINSPWIIETRSNGINTIPRNGSSGVVNRLAWLVT